MCGLLLTRESDSANSVHAAQTLFPPSIDLGKVRQTIELVPTVRYSRAQYSGL
jgi:hypothetical protein